MSTPGTILLVGASRGLGYAMAEEFLKKGWSVIGTVRDNHGAPTSLHGLVGKYSGRLTIEVLDICKEDQLDSLHNRIGKQRLDILFVNAGSTNPDPNQTIGEVSTNDFTNLMITNALSPMRVLERFEHCVPAGAGGLIGAMSSGQGSIGNNVSGERELYRGTKAALNMFMRSFAARNEHKKRSILVMAPGWVRTELGGPNARFSIEETIPSLVNVIISNIGHPGIRFLDYKGDEVPW